MSSLREILYIKKKGKTKKMYPFARSDRYNIQIRLIESYTKGSRRFEIVYLYSTRTHTYLANDLFKGRKS